MTAMAAIGEERSRLAKERADMQARAKVGCAVEMLKFTLCFAELVRTTGCGQPSHDHGDP